MSATATETAPTEATTRMTGAPAERRDLATQILHADEEAYAKQLAPLGGKEDMWQGGDVYVHFLPLPDVSC